MDQKYGEFVGVDSLHAAIITEDTDYIHYEWVWEMV